MSFSANPPLARLTTMDAMAPRLAIMSRYRSILLAWHILSQILDHCYSLSVDVDAHPNSSAYFERMKAKDTATVCCPE